MRDSRPPRTSAPPAPGLSPGPGTTKTTSGVGKSPPTFATPRKHQRVELYAQVLCKVGDEVRILHVYNASQGGLLVEAVAQDAAAFSIGGEVEFDIFTEEDSTDEPIRIHARVVRTDPDKENKMVRIGAEITSFAPNCKDRFIELLRRSRGTA